MSSYYTPDELKALGFPALGSGVSISRHCSIYGASRISIGDSVRIDDFCVITARRPMSIGSYVHISCLSFLHGFDEILLGDFVQIGSRVGIYTSTADHSGEFFTNPMVSSDLPDARLFGPVRLADHVLVGTNSTILPNVTVGEGAAIAAHTVVTSPLDGWGIYCGSPARAVRRRVRETVLEQARLFRSGREGAVPEERVDPEAPPRP